ncbi:MAG TPA: hypothetical protein VN445_00105 [Rectinemataceae bacterium]|nr:hypothetical protein [Rectinemataceae bacterium]
MKNSAAVSGNGTCSSRAWLFSRIEELWAEFKPLTPFGKDRIASRTVYSDPRIIEAAYDDTDAYESFVLAQGSEKARVDKLAWHLGRIPRLPTPNDSDAAHRAGGGYADSAEPECFDVVELFLFKKFLSNYKACHELLDDGIKEHFEFDFCSEELTALFDKGGSDPETFQISERYDNELKRLRDEISRAGEELEKENKALAESALITWGLDFMGRDFLTVPIERGLALASGTECGNNARLSVEAYDDYSCIVRMLPDAICLSLETRKETLRERESAVESAVVADISRVVQLSGKVFERYSRALERLDLARCRYMLKEKFDLRRPRLGDGGISIGGGRFLPLIRDCQAMGTAYVPMDLTIQHPVAVLFGSNMGGKTVVMESLLFFQIMAQSGAYVPAKVFSTRVFDRIEYVGEETESENKGLSSFGYQIHALCTVLKMAEGKSCLVAFDEFAHTTSSEEAEALLAAVIHRFSAMERCTALFATHFRGIARRGNIHWLKMAGLDIEAARKKFLTDAALVEDRAGGGASLKERIRSINTLMRYEIVLDGDRGGEHPDRSDALEVASLLGLESDIVEEAMLNLKTDGATAETNWSRKQ